jgi:phospholipid-binding lipoprotein MlaA
MTRTAAIAGSLVACLLLFACAAAPSAPPTGDAAAAPAASPAATAAAAPSAGPTADASTDKPAAAAADPGKPPPSRSDAGAAPVNYDPFEPVNRAIFGFNDTVDAAVIKPVARAYVDYVNDGIRLTIGNMLSNLTDLWTGFNQLLQGKPGLAISDFSRFLINSTLGFVGMADVAREVGLEKHREDFGQTLGKWGVGAGPYLVLPILGPSSVRETAGLPLDFAGNPMSYIKDNTEFWAAWAARTIDTRAGLLPAEKILEGAALDKYSFIRDGYLQRRRNLVYDGNPPEKKDPNPPEPKDSDVPDKK